MPVIICEFCHNREVKAMFKIPAANENFPQSSSTFDKVRYGICARKFRVIPSSSKAAYSGRSVVRDVNEVLSVGRLTTFIVRFE